MKYRLVAQRLEHFAEQAIREINCSTNAIVELDK